MNKFDALPLSSEDRDLVDAATALIRHRAEYGHHHIACALRTTDGQQFLGLHISSNIGRGSICAEAAAIAAALKQGPIIIEEIVAVRHTFISEQDIEVIPPCGQCRELILEYGPNAFVILKTSSGLVRVHISELFPIPFLRRKRGSDTSIYKGREP